MLHLTLSNSKLVNALRFSFEETQLLVEEILFKLHYFQFLCARSMSGPWLLLALAVVHPMPQKRANTYGFRRWVMCISLFNFATLLNR